jgi:hypothetical protein
MREVVDIAWDEVGVATFVAYIRAGCQVDVWLVKWGRS